MSAEHLARELAHTAKADINSCKWLVSVAENMIGELSIGEARALMTDHAAREAFAKEIVNEFLRVSTELTVRTFSALEERSYKRANNIPLDDDEGERFLRLILSKVSR